MEHLNSLVHHVATIIGLRLHVVVLFLERATRQVFYCMTMQINGIIMLRTLMHRVQTQILFMTTIDVLLLIMTALLVLFEACMTVVVIIDNLELLWLYYVRQTWRARLMATLTLVLRAISLIE